MNLLQICCPNSEKESIDPQNQKKGIHSGQVNPIKIRGCLNFSKCGDVS